MKSPRTPNLYAVLSGDLSSLNGVKTHGEASSGDLFSSLLPKPHKKFKRFKSAKKRVIRHVENATH